MRPRRITRMYDAQAVRRIIHDLLVDTYGSIRAAAPKVGIPHKTLHRMFTTADGDRSKEISFDKVLLVVAALQREDPTISFADILDQARDLRQSHDQ